MAILKTTFLNLIYIF